MRNSILITFCAIALLAGASKVYICTGPQSKCYHKTTDCRGLRNCSGEIKQVSVQEAKEMGRRPCKICFGE